MRKIILIALVSSLIYVATDARKKPTNGLPKPTFSLFTRRTKPIRTRPSHTRPHTKLHRTRPLPTEIFPITKFQPTTTPFIPIVIVDPPILKPTLPPITLIRPTDEGKLFTLPTIKPTISLITLIQPTDEGKPFTLPTIKSTMPPLTGSDVATI